MMRTFSLLKELELQLMSRMNPPQRKFLRVMKAKQPNFSLNTSPSNH